MSVLLLRIYGLLNTQAKRLFGYIMLLTLATTAVGLLVPVLFKLILNRLEELFTMGEKK